MTRGVRTPNKRCARFTQVEVNQEVRAELIRHYKRTLRNPSVERIRRAVGCSPNAVVAVLAEAECQRPDYKPKRSTAKRSVIDKRRQSVQKLANARGLRGARVYAPHSTSEKIRIALREEGYIVSIETVRTDVRSLGMSHLVRPKASLFSTDARSLAAREVFFNDPRWNNRNIRESLVFSDEVILTVNDHSYPRMWVRQRADLVPRERKNTFNCTRVMIWAAICVGWRSEIVFFDRVDDETGRVRTMTAQTYKLRCLSPNREFLSNGKLFIQDGASSHRAKTVLNYLDNQGIDYVKEWPASSPQFNMIESVWHDLKTRLSEDYEPTTDMEQFKANVRAAWKSIPVAKMNKHCRHFGSVIVAHKEEAARKAAAAAQH